MSLSHHLPPARGPFRVRRCVTGWAEIVAADGAVMLRVGMDGGESRITSPIALDLAEDLAVLGLRVLALERALPLEAACSPSP